MENRWWMFVGILASDGRRSATGKEPLQVGGRACVWAHSSSACHRSIMYPGGDDKSVIAAIYTPIQATLLPPTTSTLRYRFHTYYVWNVQNICAVCQNDAPSSWIEKKKKHFFFFLFCILFTFYTGMYVCAKVD